MPIPEAWRNPIIEQPGMLQQGVVASELLPSRTELELDRLETQRMLLAAGQVRFTPIQVTTEGVIWDGHHGIRAAAEKGLMVDVTIVPLLVEASGLSILDLPVR